MLSKGLYVPNRIEARTFWIYRHEYYDYKNDKVMYAYTSPFFVTKTWNGGCEGLLLFNKQAAKWQKDKGGAIYERHIIAVNNDRLIKQINVGELAIDSSYGLRSILANNGYAKMVRAKITKYAKEIAKAEKSKITKK